MHVHDVRFKSMRTEAKRTRKKKMKMTRTGYGSKNKGNPSPSHVSNTFEGMTSPRKEIGW